MQLEVARFARLHRLPPGLDDVINSGEVEPEDSRRVCLHARAQR
jgi:hypothetical protein